MYFPAFEGGVVKRSSLRISHSWWVVWQQPVVLLIVLSASILTSYIPSSFLEPDWFTLNVDQILSFPCLKHTRTFPSQNKVWGLSYGLLAPFMFWHPAISLTSFPPTLSAHSASFLLSFSLIFNSSQVYSFPEGCALADTAMHALLTDTPAPHSGHLSITRLLPLLCLN